MLNVAHVKQEKNPVSLQGITTPCWPYDLKLEITIMNLKKY